MSNSIFTHIHTQCTHRLRGDPGHSRRQCQAALLAAGHSLQVSQPGASPHRHARTGFCTYTTPHLPGETPQAQACRGCVTRSFRNYPTASQHGRVTFHRHQPREPSGAPPDSSTSMVTVHPSHPHIHHVQTNPKSEAERTFWNQTTCLTQPVFGLLYYLLTGKFSHRFGPNFLNINWGWMPPPPRFTAKTEGKAARSRQHV